MITKSLDTLRAALSTQFPSAKVDEIFLHFDTLTRSIQVGNYEVCLLNGGKFAEAVLKCLHYQRANEELDSINVEQEIKQLEAASSLSTSERMTIPRTLRLIYEHRNKRGGAHSNSFDPNEMDSVFVVGAAKWTLEELARLYLTNDPIAARMLISNLLVKAIPLVEEFEGDYLVLHPGLSARVQLQILLYRHDPSRCLTKDLAGWVKSSHNEHNVRVTLSNMKTKALVHENESGWRLTELGVRQAEIEIGNIQNVSSEGSRSQRAKARGVKHGRK